MKKISIYAFVLIVIVVVILIYSSVVKLGLGHIPIEGNLAQVSSSKYDIETDVYIAPDVGYGKDGFYAGFTGAFYWLFSDKDLCWKEKSIVNNLKGNIKHAKDPALKERFRKQLVIAQKNLDDCRARNTKK